jgi:hypothetical protein
MQAVTKIRLSYLVLPVLAWAAVMLPVTVADAADGGGKRVATVSKSVKQLKNQVRTLQQQIANLQGQVGTPRPPSGPAGGDLLGTYPNPLIKPNAVGADELANGAVTTVKITDNQVTTPKIAESAITTSKIADGAIATEDLGADSVGRSEFKGVTTAVSPIGKQIGAGQFGEVEVSCPKGGLVVAGGFAWSDDEANSIIHSAPNDNNPEQSWLVRGFVPSGSNTLYAWATCLAA